MANTLETTQAAITPGQMSQPPAARAALLLTDGPTANAMTEVVAGLDLEPVPLPREALEEVNFHEFEMVIADHDIARRLRPIISDQQQLGEQIKPALVAVGSTDLSDEEARQGDFDAILTVPCAAADLSARLSVVLFSHRALGRRYRSALEELSLNRNIFRSVSNGISVSNAQLPDMPLMYVNPSFEMMTGYTLQDVQGDNCRFLQQNDRDQPGLTLVREALQQKRQTTAVLRNYRKDGTCFWNELTLSPIFNAEGVLTHFVGIQMDVTDRVNMESALRESEKLAAVGRLASSISHEINNPLEAVMNLLYLAQHSLPQGDATRDALGFLQQADQELQRVKLITAQSLRFYKQSTGPEAILCSTLLDSVLEMYRGRMVNYNVGPEIRERSTQHIVGLASELRQVLSNLVSNAIDAMKAGGGGRLLLRTREATMPHSERGGVLLTIADTGSGMSVETQRRLYQAFFTTKGVSGTGLGLWISKEIIARHHGTLKVRSCNLPGKSYTVFQLFLPYQGASGTAPSSGLDEERAVATKA